MVAAQAYPVRVDASLGTPLSRWLWLAELEIRRCPVFPGSTHCEEGYSRLRAAGP
jgi:hypothetical protein